MTRFLRSVALGVKCYDLCKCSAICSEEGYGLSVITRYERGVLVPVMILSAGYCQMPIFVTQQISSFLNNKFKGDMVFLSVLFCVRREIIKSRISNFPNKML